MHVGRVIYVHGGLKIKCFAYRRKFFAIKIQEV